jgi:glycogen synthase
MKPLRVLGVTNFYPPAVRGGYPEICRDVMTGLAARGHAVTMLTCDDGTPGPAEPDDSESPVEVRRELDYVLAAWRRPRAAFRALAHDQRVLENALSPRPDAAIVWHMRGVVKPPLHLLHEAEIPVLYMLHDRWVLYERAGPWLKPWPLIDRLGLSALRNAIGALAAPRIELRSPPIDSEGIICFVSESLRDEYERLGWRPRHARIVPGGVQIERFRAAREEESSRMPPSRILFAGRIHPTKGLHVAIAALAQSSEVFALTVVGPVDDAGYLSSLQAETNRVGLGDRVTWRGPIPRERMPALLAEHDILVYPSITPETFGLSAVEALASGAVVVSSAVGGPREYLEHGRNALLFDPGDAAELAAVLRSLAEDPDLVRRLVTGGADTARSLSLEAMVERTETILAEARL